MLEAKLEKKVITPAVAEVSERTVTLTMDYYTAMNIRLSLPTQPPVLEDLWKVLRKATEDEAIVSPAPQYVIKYRTLGETFWTRSLNANARGVFKNRAEAEKIATQNEKETGMKYAVFLRDWD